MATRGRERFTVQLWPADVSFIRATGVQGWAIVTAALRDFQALPKNERAEKTIAVLSEDSMNATTRKGVSNDQAHQG